MSDRLVNQLKRHEGFRVKPYLCSAGKTTIGYGHNLSDKGITEKQAYDLLINDIAIASHDVLKHITASVNLDNVRRDVLINMSFNLGINRLLGFKKMLAAIDEHDYKLASDEMMDSRWAVQVGSRSNELALQMLTGEYG